MSSLQVTAKGSVITRCGGVGLEILHTCVYQRAEISLPRALGYKVGSFQPRELAPSRPSGFQCLLGELL